ncbi:MAG: metal ABC transporter permease [Anaerolineae bacterium]|nr:metal ABC transporter permease [Anaerolineae bacterium]
MDILQTLLQALIDPISQPIMQRVMLAVLVIGVVSGVVGAYVVTRGMAFLGDALAHTILPGVAIAYMAGGGSTQAVLIGGIIAGVISAVIISVLGRISHLSEDTAIGIVFAGALALGIGIISSSRAFTTDFTHLFMGNILGVSNEDLLLMLVIGGVVILGTIAFYKEFLAISFDPTLAEALHMPTGRLNITLLILMALTVVIALQAVGIALVAGMIVIPAATARYFVKRLHHLMVAGAIIGAVGGVLGIYASFYLNVAPSAAIVLVLVILFAIAFLFSPRQGYAWQLVRRPLQTNG